MSVALTILSITFGFITLVVGLKAWWEHKTMAFVTCPVCGKTNSRDKEALQKIAATGDMINHFTEKKHPCFVEATKDPGTWRATTIDIGCGANLAGVWLKHPYIRTLIRVTVAMKAEFAETITEVRDELADAAHDPTSRAHRMLGETLKRAREGSK